MVREILVDWTTASGSGKVSVFHFSETFTAADSQLALSGLMVALRPFLSTTTRYDIRSTGRDYDTTTGTVEAEWTGTAGYGNFGTGSGQPVADASQILLRWKSGFVLNGRFLNGRTYIPGLVVGNLSSGNILPASLVTISAAANTFATGGGGPVIWHRPTNGLGGLSSDMDSGSAWSELAVLRRRRG